MQLPFSFEQFLAVFRAYNVATGIAPLLLILIALGIVAAAGSGPKSRDRGILSGLAVLWLWAGAVYHWMFFTAINAAAWVFGALFVAQGIMLLQYARRAGGGGARHGRGDARGSGGEPLAIRAGRDAAGIAGWVLVAYSLVVYPILGWLQGHSYPAGPTFGAPCPVTIFFLGVVLWVRGPIPGALLVVPLAWAVIGTSAAVQLGMLEDLALPLSAAIVLAEFLRRHRHGGTEPGESPTPSLTTP